MQLMTNANPLTLDVTLGNGQRVSMYVQPHEAWFDWQGYVRLFSIHFDDGAIGNFKLLPQSSTRDDVVKFVKKFIAPFGLGLAAGQIISGNKAVHNLAKFLAVNFAADAVGRVLDEINEYYNFVEELNPVNHAYYEVTSGELVIRHPVKLTFG